MENVLTLFAFLCYLTNIWSKSADRIMCMTPAIEIRPCRQIQINGYCYYRGDLDTGILPRILFLSAESHET